ncbi:hypothetical protein Dda_6504 [Drechslerella dactyloides]|uniref:Uncharacterized protein n=1 Tax=Drechslerella dactyloides TaxID=74499 RepID=A0AAD6ITX1_DREDA|nr:hypothetical protein Dda_6504 [Drechslerella dactyloides]
MEKDANNWIDGSQDRSTAPVNKREERRWKKMKQRTSWRTAGTTLMPEQVPQAPTLHSPEHRST